MIYVPEKFRPKHPFRYPEDNETDFERWYYENYDYQLEERQYLPILWTAYYVKANFGQNKRLMDDLQRFLNTLNRSLKYYTLVQYDNGILHNLTGLDIKVFSMSGGRADYPLPLISMPHEQIISAYERRSRHFYNFIGKETHPIRATMIAGMLKNWSNYVSTAPHSLKAYCQILHNSTFTLCPRGFGPTSFRIQEALQYGSIPVYISDEFVIPHNLPFEDYGVLIDAADVQRVHEILMSIPPEEIKRKQEAIPEIYKKYFTYEGNKKLIQEEVDKCDHPAGSVSF
jgi:hypothetical protein